MTVRSKIIAKNLKDDKKLMKPFVIYYNTSVILQKVKNKIKQQQSTKNVKFVDFF